jgi:cell division protein FtsI/penicillin-binding protein 2
MDTSFSRSFLSFLSVLLACSLAAAVGRQLVLSVNEEAPRIYRADGYVEQVRRMLDSPRGALALEKKKLVFHPEKASEDERKFYGKNATLRRDVERFNDGSVGFFSLGRKEDGGVTLELDDYFHNVPLPVPSGEGELNIEISGAKVPVLSGQDLKLMFDAPQAEAENATRTLDPAEWLRGSRQQHQAVAFLLRDDGGNLLLLSQPKLGQIHLQLLQNQGAQVQVNGVLVKRDAVGQSAAGRLLLDGDRVLITQAGGRQVALRFGLTQGGLRLDTQAGHQAPLLAQAAEAVRALQGRSDITATGALAPFTLDLRLQTQLQKALQGEVTRLDAALRGRMPDIDKHPACITVLDALSGEALALASYPDAATLERWDAAWRSGADIGLKEARLEALHRNQNLQRIPIGSTTKPMLATAIWETAPALRKLHVEGGPQTAVMYGHTLTSPMRNPSDGTHWGPVEWLQKSSNPYTLAAYLAALAPADSYTLDARGILRPNGGKLDLSRYVKPRDAAGRDMKPEFFQPGSVPPVNLKLQDCFNIDLSESAHLYDASVLKPWLEKLGLDEKKVPRALHGLLPESTHLGMQSYQYLRGDLVSMVIGGGGNRWSNLKLAEAYARIGTGMKVEATLVKRAKAADFSPMPVSTATLNLVREGMTAAVMNGGTASAESSGLRPALEKQQARLAKRGLKLVVHGKTGTATRDAGRECAALALYLALHDGKDTRRAALACTIYLEDRAGSTNSVNAVKLCADISEALISQLERLAAEKK